MMLWRNGGGCNCFIGIERTLATDGTPNSDGVTMVVVKFHNINFQQRSEQQTIVFGVGAANFIGSPVVLARGYVGNTTTVATTDSFNNNVPISPVFPSYGKFGNPMTVVGSLRSVDVAEGGLLQTTLYGATRTYLCSSANNFLAFGPQASGQALAMRYD